MKNKPTAKVMYREVTVMPESEHKRFLKLVKIVKKSKSLVIREAIEEKINTLNS